MSAQLVVTGLDGGVRFYGCEQGWRVDPAWGCIVIGRFPRTYIPLCNVASFDVEPAGERHPDAEGWLTEAAKAQRIQKPATLHPPIMRTCSAGSLLNWDPGTDGFMIHTGSNTPCLHPGPVQEVPADKNKAMEIPGHGEMICSAGRLVARYSEEMPWWHVRDERMVGPCRHAGEPKLLEEDKSRSMEATETGDMICSQGRGVVKLPIGEGEQWWHIRNGTPTGQCQHPGEPKLLEEDDEDPER